MPVIVTIVFQEDPVCSHKQLKALAMPSCCVTPGQCDLRLCLSCACCVTCRGDFLLTVNVCWFASISGSSGCTAGSVCAPQGSLGNGALQCTNLELPLQPQALQRRPRRPAYHWLRCTCCSAQAWAFAETTQGQDTLANTLRTISMPVGTCDRTSKDVPDPALPDHTE
jgi:hypothetical protein